MSALQAQGLNLKLSYPFFRASVETCPIVKDLNRDRTLAMINEYLIWRIEVINNSSIERP